MSAISLRSGKEIEVPSRNNLEEQKDKLNYEEAEEKKKSTEQEVRSEPNSNILTNRISLPFPCRKNKSMKEEVERELFETFRKVEINIPLLDAIKQVPRYAKFLKELCTSKKNCKGMKF